MKHIFSLFPFVLIGTVFLFSSSFEKVTDIDDNVYKSSQASYFDREKNINDVWKEIKHQA